MSSRAGRHVVGSLWEQVRDSTVSVWASLGRWDRVGVVVGGVLLLTSAAMALDSRMLRHEAYEQRWMDQENQKNAAQLDSLLKAAYKQQELERAWQVKK